MSKRTVESDLVAYGFEKTDEGFVLTKAGRPKTKWVPTEGGFHRFEREDGEWVQYPHSVNAKFARVSGLTYAEHPECFDTVYSVEEVGVIYAAALEERRAREEEASARRRAKAS